MRFLRFGSLCYVGLIEGVEKMKEEKYTIDLIIKALMKYIEAAIQKMEMDQKWHEEIMGIVTPDLDEDEPWTDEFMGEWV